MRCCLWAFLLLCSTSVHAETITVKVVEHTKGQAAQTHTFSVPFEIAPNATLSVPFGSEDPDAVPVANSGGSALAGRLALTMENGKLRGTMTATISQVGKMVAPVGACRDQSAQGVPQCAAPGQQPPGVVVRSFGTVVQVGETLTQMGTTRIRVTLDVDP